jgi:TolA-binding protein
MRRALGTSATFLVLGLVAAAVAGDAVSFDFTLDKECPTSAGVYAPDGRLVRTLWSQKPTPAGKRTGKWDGRDDLGRNVPAGAYEVRVACGTATYASVGTIGNSGVGKPMQAGTDDVLVNRKTGDIYTANNWEEAGQDFRKMDADGKHLMDAQFRVRNGTPNGWPIAVALDNGVLYCSVFTVNETVPGETKKFNGGAVIRKFSADKGEPFKYPTESGYIRVKLPDPKDETPFEHQSLHSITICGETIVAADRFTGRVHKFDKASGQSLGEFAFTKPVCVITDEAQRLWIAHDGGRVSVVNLDGKVLAQPPVAARQIACIRLGPDHRLWVADQDSGQIQVYQIETLEKLTQVKTYGHKAQPGEFAPLAIGRIQSFDAAVVAMNRVMELKAPPDRHYAPQALLEIAGVHVAAGKLDEAQRELRKVKDHFQTTKFAHPHLHWQAYLATADLLRRQQKYTEAIREYEQSMQIQGLDDNALARCEMFIGECRLAMNEPVQGAEHYLAAVVKHPKADAGTKVQALLTAGDCQVRAGNRDAARKCYEQARDLPGASADQMKTARQKIEQLAK